MKVVLTIAGSDPSGGAGIQGDLKTFAAHGVYGMAVITALTVQNTRGVTRVAPVAPDLVGEQIGAVLDDIPPDAIKVGMLATAPIVRAVAAALEPARRAGVPIVLDPVFGASLGGMLLDDEGVVALREHLFALARVITPNALEAARLTGLPVRTVAEARQAAVRLVELGAAAAIVTGGHLDGPPMDILADGPHLFDLPGERVTTSGTHGTGCAFASAVAARLALGDSLERAARHAKDFVTAALGRAPGLGEGAGPIGHR
jgi:hydroxymethylpyrimidine kinase/phosphomethylpyrimidine kinase